MAGSDKKMRDKLSASHQIIYDRHYNSALNAVADVDQAHAIARERTLAIIMRNSAAVVVIREHTGERSVRDKPARVYRDGNPPGERRRC